MSENTPQQTKKRKAPRSAFKPGQSGNPGGRPKQVGEVVELARQHTQEAVQRLVFWMRSTNPQASVRATESIMERAWGKPVQPMEVTGKDGSAIQIERALRNLSLEELETMMKMYDKIGITHKGRE